MRVYKHSINKYRINLITKQDEVPVTVDLWGTELGIQEWIEANKMDIPFDITDALKWSEGIVRDATQANAPAQRFDLDSVALHPVFGTVMFFGLIS